MAKIRKQLLRYGEWKHSSAPNGVLKVDRTFVDKIVSMYQRSPFVPILRGHNDPRTEISSTSLEKLAEVHPELILSKTVEKLEATDDGLYAEFDLPEGELGNYNDVSISLIPEYEDHETGQKFPLLRHVAMVLNPYIKGLKPFTQLNEDAYYTISLSDIMTDEIKTEDTGVKPDVQEVIEEVESTDLSEIEKLKAEIALLKAEKNKNDAEKSYTDLLAKGKLTPKQKDSYVALMEALNVDSINLADDGGLGKAIKTFIEDLPVQVDFSEKGVDLESLQTTGTSEEDIDLLKTLYPSFADLTEDELTTKAKLFSTEINKYKQQIKNGKHS